jgi:hypothetical protein
MKMFDYDILFQVVQAFLLQLQDFYMLNPNLQDHVILVALHLKLLVHALAQLQNVQFEIYDK